MKAASAAERRHMGRVAGLGCVLCQHLGLGNTPPEVHHLKEGEGLSQRAPHWLTIPLCTEHHRGANGLHGLGTSGFYTRYKLVEIDLLAMTIELLAMRFTTGGVIVKDAALLSTGEVHAHAGAVDREVRS